MEIEHSPRYDAISPSENVVDGKRNRLNFVGAHDVSESEALVKKFLARLEFPDDAEIYPSVVISVSSQIDRCVRVISLS